MTLMPLCAAREHDFALDWRLAALAPRAEGLVEVEVAVKSQTSVPIIVMSVIFRCAASTVHYPHLAVLARLDPRQSLLAASVRLGVEGNAFESCVAVKAGEAFRVEACAGGGDDAAGNGQGAVCAEGGRAPDGGGVLMGRCEGVIRGRVRRAYWGSAVRFYTFRGRGYFGWLIDEDCGRLGYTYCWLLISCY